MASLRSACSLRCGHFVNNLNVRFCYHLSPITYHLSPQSDK
ncbi:gluconate 5-dehydrogenase [Yersinia pseudotuberculosis]|nr:gluconate 5-dehydrogenase [Yersinia pseudotuberculosis]